jgi:hypothetical protein
MLEGGTPNLNVSPGSSRGQSTDCGAKWREDLQVGFTIFGVLFLVSVAAAVGVKLLLGY